MPSSLTPSVRMPKASLILNQSEWRAKCGSLGLLESLIDPKEQDHQRSRRRGGGGLILALSVDAARTRLSSRGTSTARAVSLILVYGCVATFILNQSPWRRLRTSSRSVLVTRFMKTRPQRPVSTELLL